MGLLSAPFMGLLSVFEEIAKRAEGEIWDEDAIRAQLTDLYMRLEAGSLDEESFTRREAELVERLEEIGKRRRHARHGRH